MIDSLLITELREAAKNLKREVLRFNKRLLITADDIEDAKTVYNTLLKQARELVADRIAETEAFHDRHLADWWMSRESTLCRDRITQLRAVRLDDIDLLIPQEMDVPDLDAAKILEQLEETT